MSGDTGELPATPAFLKQREALEPGLREQYDALVMDYRYYAFVNHRGAYVSYKVLADLVRAGWRNASTDTTS